MVEAFGNAIGTKGMGKFDVLKMKCLNETVGENKIFENVWKSDLGIKSCGWVSKLFS